MDSGVIHKAWSSAEKCERCAIRNMVLFADLTREDFEMIHNPIHDFELRAGDTLYDTDTSSEYVYTIRAGLIKLVSYLPDGSYRIVRILKQGDVAGLEALSEDEYLHDAIALEVSSICRIPVSLVNKLNENTPHLSNQLTTRWRKVMADADLWLSRLSVGVAKQKVAALLLHLADKEKGGACYLPSRDDMGAILAMTPETASRVIADFKREGWITPVSPHRITVDIAAMQHIDNEREVG